MNSSGSSERMTPDQFVARLQQLVAANIAGSTQLVNRFTELVREASQTISATPAAQRTDAQVLLSRWLDFNLASFSVVSSQSLALLNGLITAAETTLIRGSQPGSGTAPSGTPSNPTTPAPRVELRLSGRHGERATTGFAIENNFERAHAVTFESSALTASNGATLPASLVNFEPPTLVLQARGQGTVQVTVGITKDFEVGQTYTATIRLLGHEAKEVGLSIGVLPPADDAVPANVAAPVAGAEAAPESYRKPRRAGKRRTRARK